MDNFITCKVQQIFPKNYILILDSLTTDVKDSNPAADSESVRLYVLSINRKEWKNSTDQKKLYTENGSSIP